MKRIRVQPITSIRINKMLLSDERRWKVKQAPEVELEHPKWKKSTHSGARAPNVELKYLKWKKSSHSGAKAPKVEQDNSKLIRCNHEDGNSAKLRT